MSSPESDYDIATATDGTNDESRQPTRASSDPSIAVVDNIPQRPVEPPPAPPRHEPHPQLAYDPRYVSATHVTEVLGFLLIFLYVFRVLNLP